MRSIPLRLWGLAFLSGVLQVLSFPIAGPIPAWRSALSWIALTPLLVCLTRETASANKHALVQGTLLGYVSGFIWYLGNCYWIFTTMHTYGGLSQPVSAGILVLFCLYLGLYHALFGLVVSALRRSLGANFALTLSPFVWVAVELARARITGFPWDLLGITQVDNPLLIRVAPYTGAYGLSFVVATVNAIWLTRISIRERRHTRTILTAGGVAFVVLYVLFLRHLHTIDHETATATATLVQENLSVGIQSSEQEPLTKEQMLKAFSALSLFPATEFCRGIPELPGAHCDTPTFSTARSGAHVLVRPDLIVWPEAPNGFFDSDAEFRNAVSQLAHTIDAPVIAGSIGLTENPRIPHGYDLYNSADFIRSDGSFAGRYDKMHLVPFGEYVPYKKLLFFAGNLLANVGEFEPGSHRVLFKTGGHAYGTFICYESVFGDEVRQYARMGAEVLVNISDDGWYGDTSAAWEHLNMLRMRAIENHRWILRATNTGVTASVDPYGRVIAAIPRHTRSSLRAGFAYEHDLTFYSAHGDLFAYACLLLTISTVGWAAWKQSPRRSN